MKRIIAAGPPALLGAVALILSVQALLTLDGGPAATTVAAILSGFAVAGLCAAAVVRGPSNRLAGPVAGASTTAAAVVLWIGLVGLAGIGGWRWSWLVAPLGLAAAPTAVAWAAFLPFRRGRWWASIVVGVAGIAVAVFAVAVTPPSHGRVAEALDRIELPTDWQLLEEREDGSTWCFFDACPTIERRYRTPAGTDTDSILRRALDDAGFEPQPNGNLGRGRVTVRMQADDDGGDVTLTGEAS